MKGFSILILLALLLFPDYAFSQTCPCDTLALNDGTTGSEIVELLCPGGEVGEGTIVQLSPDEIEIGSQSLSLGYEVQIPPDSPPFCSITDGVTSFFPAQPLSDEEAAICRQRLIQGCNLQQINPIPTLSQWGMIAMAGVLGIIGLIVAARRRKAAV